MFIYLKNTIFLNHSIKLIIYIIFNMGVALSCINTPSPL